MTAHNECAVEAFELHAREEISSAVQALRSTAGHDPFPQRFLAKNGNASSVVPVGDFEWNEAAGYYACLHAGGKKHLINAFLHLFIHPMIG